MSMMESVSKAGASGFAMVIWGLSIVVILGAVNEARLLVTSRQNLQLAQATVPPSIEVSEVAVNTAEYEKIAEMVKQMHPQLRVGADQQTKGIYTEATDLAAYYEWLISIYDIMTAVPNARWSTVNMCAGDGCQGAKYRIVMSATRREISVKRSEPMGSDGAAQ